jgi:hypothetical protein
LRDLLWALGTIADSGGMARIWGWSCDRGGVTTLTRHLETVDA